MRRRQTQTQRAERDVAESREARLVCVVRVASRDVWHCARNLKRAVYSCRGVGGGRNGQEVAWLHCGHRPPATLELTPGPRPTTKTCDDVTRGTRPLCPAAIVKLRAAPSHAVVHASRRQAPGVAAIIGADDGVRGPAKRSTPRTIPGPIVVVAKGQAGYLAAANRVQRLPEGPARHARILPSWNRGSRRGRHAGRAGRGVVVSAREAAQQGSQTRRQGAGTERTSNMAVVTGLLEVSKLSGWLNPLAYCRVERGGCGESGAACGARGGGEGVKGRRGRRELRRVTGQGGTRGAHVRHV